MIHTHIYTYHMCMQYIHACMHTYIHTCMHAGIRTYINTHDMCISKLDNLF